MEYGIKYEIDENNHLILKSIYNNMVIGTIDSGDIEEILNKVKLFDEEYNNLIKQNDLMKEIQEDYNAKNQIIDYIEKALKDPSADERMILQMVLAKLKTFN